MILRAERLYGVNPRLVTVVLGAGCELDFTVTCGLRTLEEQRALVQKGASQTMKSYHLTGDAVDIAVMVGGKITWDFNEYKRASVIFKRVAMKHGVVLTWGGDWQTLRDGPHFQIERGDPLVAA